MTTSSRTACQPVSHQTATTREHDERVEVQTAEVRAHPPGPAEAVAVGDVGVEGRPEEVDPEAHRARGRAAVAAGGRVAELVEAGRQHGDPDDGEEQRRVAERLGRGRRQPLAEQHPARDGDEREHHRHDDERRNSTANGAVSRRVTAGSVTTRRNRSASSGSDRRSSGSVPSARGSRPSGRSEESTSCRTSSAAHQPPGRGADPSATSGDGPLPVHGDQHLVQQGRQLDDLAVRAADQGGRLR